MGAVQAKVGGMFGRKWGWFWVKNGSVLGKCQDAFGSHLQWTKWEPRERFKKLGANDFKNL